MAKLSQKARLETPPPSSKAEIRPSPQSRILRADHLRQVVDDSGDDEDNRNSAQTEPQRPPSKRQRRDSRPRMLPSIGLDHILAGRTSQHNEDTQHRLSISGLKAPTIDPKATRRSGRSAAQKPVVYNMKIHPQDHSLPYRRSIAAESMREKQDDDEEHSDHSSMYRSDGEGMNEDVIKAAKSDREADLSDDYMRNRKRGLKVPTRDPAATRRSARSTARKAVNYNINIHPNDIDIGWPSRKSVTTEGLVKPTHRNATQDGQLEQSDQEPDFDTSSEVDRPKKEEHSPENGQQPMTEDELRADLPRSRSQTLEHVEASYFDRADSLELGGSSYDWEAEQYQIDDALEIAMQATQA